MFVGTDNELISDLSEEVKHLQTLLENLVNISRFQCLTKDGLFGPYCYTHKSDALPCPVAQAREYFQDRTRYRQLNRSS